LVKPPIWISLNRWRICRPAPATTAVLKIHSQAIGEFIQCKRRLCQPRVVWQFGQPTELAGMVLALIAALLDLPVLLLQAPPNPAGVAGVVDQAPCSRSAAWERLAELSKAMV
jgi:hypothetical protein